ncbi:unnamed protein product [Lasius platythorax]|uniref:CCHC-type domain-containing protein n=2 Tax=Lasius TaxID=488720 RepID=A0A0J7K8B9_LASNI|nr:hypothetical protein RF55_14411 [Lasius niger]
MERERLETMTFEQLRDEASKYQVPLSTDRDRLIENILGFWQRNSADSVVPRTAPPSKEVSGSRTGLINNPSGQSTSADIATVAESQEQLAIRQIADTLNVCLAQQRYMMEELKALSSRGASNIPESAQEREVPQPLHKSRNSSDDENVVVWTQRVDKVARVHGATDDVTLLAASGKLTKTAKAWYDIQSGEVLESWSSLKQEIVKMFDRQVSFMMAMQKIEARRWLPHKESFDQYAMEKLTLIHTLNLPARDVISLLIGGIQQSSLRAAALTLTSQSLDKFLEAMRRITAGMSDCNKKPFSNSKNGKAKDITCKTCGKKGHLQQDCRNAERVCNYCKGSGHWKADCPKLKKSSDGDNILDRRGQGISGGADYIGSSHGDGAM